ncbi:hypothetical protein DFH09DRAFT_1110910 [Mycena vulgaris]|nr:hypothetical protein DFH09DRAFT_1110910 [Mycena vulgaris]
MFLESRAGTSQLGISSQVVQNLKHDPKNSFWIQNNSLEYKNTVPPDDVELDSSEEEEEELKTEEAREELLELDRDEDDGVLPDECAVNNPVHRANLNAAFCVLNTERKESKATCGAITIDANVVFLQSVTDPNTKVKCRINPEIKGPSVAHLQPCRGSGFPRHYQEHGLRHVHKWPKFQFAPIPTENAPAEALYNPSHSSASIGAICIALQESSLAAPEPLADPAVVGVAEHKEDAGNGKTDLSKSGKWQSDGEVRSQVVGVAPVGTRNDESGDAHAAVVNSAEEIRVQHPGTVLLMMNVPAKRGRGQGDRVEKHKDPQAE